MPITYRSAFSATALLLYLSCKIVWLSAIWFIENSSFWWFALLPAALAGQVLVVMSQRYHLDYDRLRVKALFEVKDIPLNEIRSVEVLHNPRWKQWITGVPAVSLKVHYLKYEEVLLHPAQHERLQQALTRTGRAAALAG